MIIPVEIIEKTKIDVTQNGGKKFLSSSMSSKLEGYRITSIKINIIETVIPEKKKTIHESRRFIFY